MRDECERRNDARRYLVHSPKLAEWAAEVLAAPDTPFDSGASRVGPATKALDCVNEWPDLGFAPHQPRTMVLKRLPFSATTASGIEITHSENMPAIHGILVAVHPTCDPRLAYGDWVRYERYAVEHLDYGGEEYVFVHEDDVEIVIHGQVEFSLELEGQEASELLG